MWRTTTPRPHSGRRTRASTWSWCTAVTAGCSRSSSLRWPTSGPTSTAEHPEPGALPHHGVPQDQGSLRQDFPIEYRFSATDLVPGGLELPEAIEFAKIMDDEVDAFQVSSGMISDPTTYPYTLCADYLEYGENAERTAEIKRAVKKPVAVVGAIPHLEFGGQLIADGKADMVALCRPLIADPALPRRL